MTLIAFPNDYNEPKRVILTRDITHPAWGTFVTGTCMTLEPLFKGWVLRDDEGHGFPVGDGPVFDFFKVLTTRS